MDISLQDAERITKLKALVDRGATPGERQAARCAIDRIMSKYGHKPTIDHDEDIPDMRVCFDRIQGFVNAANILCVQISDLADALKVCSSYEQ